MTKPQTPEPERVAALQDAVDEYQDALTKAELIRARAEIKMAEAIKEARSRKPIPWRIIADMFGTTHQAVMSKWQDKIKNTSSRSAGSVVPSTESGTTEPNPQEQYQ